MSNLVIFKDINACPITSVMQVVGGKWKPIIIYVLSKGTLRFGKIIFFIPNISRKVLTQQLRELEQDGIVKRTVYNETPPRVEYELTKKGLELLPIYEQLAEWGLTYSKKDA